MRLLLSYIAFLLACPVFSQSEQENKIDDNILFLRQTEKEMIEEINKVRTNPRGYLQYIMPYLENAKIAFKKHGKEPTSYSLRKHYKKNDAGTLEVIIDTLWYNQYVEELKALSTLVRKLQSMRPLNALKPHKGIYKAATVHSKELASNNWELSHQGANGQWPAQRIKNYAETMETGNENLVSLDAVNTTREIVITLLIDAGLKGHRHRTNILNPSWTHIACYYGGYFDKKHQWIQNFAKEKSTEQKTEGLP